MLHKNKRGGISQFLINALFMIFSLLCIIPIITIISISFSREADIYSYGFRLIPLKITTLPYEIIFKNPMQIINSYFISILVSVVGMILSLLLISMIAYPLSRLDFKYRNKLAFFVFFTMLFNGGMVPWYITISRLQLKDTIWVLILPYIANAWFILLLRTFIQTISISIIESAKIDGASEFRVFFTLILPLAKPGLATVGLFIVLNYWNDWWLAMLFISSERLVPLQYMLYRMMSNIDFLSKNMSALPAGIDMRSMPSETTRMAMCVLAAGPMLFVFPFFQKYFVKGLTVGAIKG